MTERSEASVVNTQSEASGANKENNASEANKNNEDQDQGFVARLNNYKLLKQFFQAVNVNDGNASVYLQSHGLKMTVEDSKCFQV